MNRAAWMFVGLAAASSCVSLAPAPPLDGTAGPRLSRAECAALDRSFRRFNIAAALAGLTALSSGIGGALTDDQPDAELAFGIAGLVSGLTAGVSGIFSARRAGQYVSGCTVNSGGR